ncbi:MFS transporter, DHA1 family, tetracycline resistance protein [Gammaproteobacteria bacterium]
MNVVFSQWALVFIFITVMLDVLALGMVMPVLPELIHTLTGADAAYNAQMVGLFGTLWALTQFLFAPVLGMLSDRIGRRPVILLSNLGLGFDYVLMAVAPHFSWLLVGRIISGIAAGNFTAAGAYIADITPLEKRASGFGIQNAAFGFGFGLGPALGGLLGTVDLRLPFWVAAGLILTNFCWVFFLLPESLSRQQRGQMSWQRANPLGTFQFLRTQPELFNLTGVMLLSFVALEVMPSTFVLFAQYRFGWDTGMVGLTLSSVGVGIALVQIGLVAPMIAWLGERRTILVGLGCGALGLTVYGLASTGAVLWIGAPIIALWGLFGPAAQSLMSRVVSVSQQGLLQGAVNSLLHGLGGLIAPSLFTMTFAMAITTAYPQQLAATPFLLAALLLIGALLLAWRGVCSPPTRN